jgi:hypothetical protein
MDAPLPGAPAPTPPGSLGALIGALAGRRTYLVAIAVAAVALLHALGLLSADTAAALYGLLGAGGLATLRAAVPSAPRDAIAPYAGAPRIFDPEADPPRPA